MFWNDKYNYIVSSSAVNWESKRCVLICDSLLMKRHRGEVRRYEERELCRLGVKIPMEAMDCELAS